MDPDRVELTFAELTVDAPVHGTCKADMPVSLVRGRNSYLYPASKGMSHLTFTPKPGSRCPRTDMSEKKKTVRSISGSAAMRLSKRRLVLDGVGDEVSQPQWARKQFAGSWVAIRCTLHWDRDRPQLPSAIRPERICWSDSICYRSRNLGRHGNLLASARTTIAIRD